MGACDSGTRPTSTQYYDKDYTIPLTPSHLNTKLELERVANVGMQGEKQEHPRGTAAATTTAIATATCSTESL